MKKIFNYIIIIFLLMSNVSLSVFAHEDLEETTLLDPINVIDIKEGAYLLESNVIDSSRINKIYYEVYTANQGKDDLEEGTLEIEDNKVSLLLSQEKHNNEEGEYIVNIFVLDNDEITTQLSVDPIVIENKTLETNGDGEKAVIENEENKESGTIDEETETSYDLPTIASFSLEPIQISNVQVKLYGGKYTVTATVDSTNGVDRVEFPTWTAKNGQDDITWHKGTISGNTVTYTVDMGDHNYEVGTYFTHIYAYDKAGNETFYAVPAQVIANEAPIIKDVKVTNYAGHYTISATVTDDYAIDRVEFPTWTAKNGQDDITWHKGTISGNTVTYTVDMGYHNHETGTYFTHIYAYDKGGNKAFYAVPAQVVKNEAPTIKDVKATNYAGKYTITATVTDDYAIDRVEFPTWTAKNGQDDITWEKGAVNGNTVTYTVDMSKHNYETGTYYTHIYAYDKAGKQTFYAVPKQTIGNNAPSIKNVKVTNYAGHYTITATVTDDYAIDRVEFPTWTAKNGQDDITWHKGTISGNTVTYTVDMGYHNYEAGTYYTHIYAYDKAGNKAFYAVPAQIIKNEAPTIKDVKVTNYAGKYTITATVTDDYAIDRVEFPTWTAKNGQDDITWHKGTISGNTVTYTVDMGYHNHETGTYFTHIYAYDKGGNKAFYAVPAQQITNNPPVITKASVSNIGEGYYTIDCFVQDDYGVDYVSFATWSKYNWQDDITWQKVPIVDGKASLTIYAKDHKYESGEYITHVYAYDKAGANSFTQITSNMQAPNMQQGWKVIDGQKYLFNTNGEVVMGANKLIIDISEHNGNIDWNKVKSSGVDGVILRCGYGWSDDINDQRDAKFIENAKELERLGIPYGVYLFSYENSSKGALLEAEYTLKLIKGRKITLPVYYDLEYSNYVGTLSQKTYVEMAKAYCDRINAAGYTAGIYANLNYWNNKLNDPSLDKYVKWVAQYNTNNGQAGHCDYTKSYKMWQYTSVGSVSGISGNVDMNALFE